MNDLELKAMEMLGAGDTLDAVAEKTGLGRRRLLRLAKESGVRLLRGRRATAVSETQREQASEVYREKKSIALTAQATGLSEWVTRQVLADAGLVARPQAPTKKRG